MPAADEPILEATAERPELLAPAGDPAAAWAALQYGADAIYAGLPRLSARVDAINFTPAELRRVVAFAHRLQPRRRVYAALNTLLQEPDLPAAVETLEEAADAGVDAVILQDFGLLRLARRHFPRLPLHASTQLAIHNLAGVQALAELGFTRVVLARELSLDEVAHISRQSPIEIELFVHGALCYSYSGLCLFSSMHSGRSGNRGRCAYCCREPFAAVPDAGPAKPATFPFSMRDLALAPLCPQLAASGARSLKIEGRMKNALYVAAVTDYYRRKLDGRLSPDEETALQRDLQTIFSRPWTQLYAADAAAPATAIIDPLAVGHRGAVVGTVQAVVRDARGGRWLRFRSNRALEKHDGLQLDVPRGGKPFGFAVDALRRAGDLRLTVAQPADVTVEVQLPAEDVPEISPGASVSCSASQAVRRRYPVTTPRESDCHPGLPVAVRAELRTDGFSLSARTLENDDEAVSARVAAPLALTPARQPEQTASAVRRAVERTGDTLWQVSELEVLDPTGLFVPASALNEARRALFVELSVRHAARRAMRRQEAMRAIAASPKDRAEATERWILKIASTAPAQPAYAQADEIVLGIEHQGPDALQPQLDRWLELVPRERLRLALPLIARGGDEERILQEAVSALLRDGWTRWECSGLAGFRTLRQAANQSVDLTADWSCYGLNHLAREQWRELGATRHVASPEDTAANLAALSAAAGPALEVLAWQHTPLFISETPPVGGTGQPPWCWANRRGGQLITREHDGRWVTSSVDPYCLAAHLPGLRASGVRWFRADLSWSPPKVDGARAWTDTRAGVAPAAHHIGNFERGFR